MNLLDGQIPDGTGLGPAAHIERRQRSVGSRWLALREWVIEEKAHRTKAHGRKERGRSMPGYLPLSVLLLQIVNLFFAHTVGS